MNDVEIRSVSDDAEIRRIYKLAESCVSGFSAGRAASSERHERRRITRLLPVDSDGLIAGTRHIGAFRDGKLIAGAFVHPIYLEAIDRISNGVAEETIRLMLASRRTLSGLAVLPEFRRKGIASRLVERAISIARRDGARWLTGFMDEKNGTPDFYRNLGFRVGERNRPLPPLAPANIREAHPRYVNGWWFHMDLSDDGSAGTQIP
ncbi:GNAT family N-acetyltransferase [Microbacterium maritypicum]|uniref:GNAT family N-acetyltransferase n=1 Tax=Microbacterium maritypicum TaxID=33918 RepID=UPI0022E4F375|nr:GNAT family N-acetyltransferase [Microbacterium liquefaciens]